MPIRLYLTPIVTDATEGVEGRTRPKVGLVKEINWTMIYPATSGSFGLAVVNAENEVHASLGSDVDLDQFPDLDYSQPFSAVLTQRQFESLMAKADKRGVDVTGLTLESLLTDLVQRVLDALVPGMKTANLRAMKV